MYVLFFQNRLEIQNGNVLKLTFSPVSNQFINYES